MGGDNRHHPVKMLGTDMRYYTVCKCQLATEHIEESGNVLVSALGECPNQAVPR